MTDKDQIEYLNIINNLNQATIQKMEARINELESFVIKCYDNYGCDDWGTEHGPTCRRCESKRLTENKI